MSFPQIIISFTFLLFQVILASNDCNSRFCGSNPFAIRFPFWLPGQQPRMCGYPGFNLRCAGQDQHAVLHLPYSGDFFVRDINYLDQEIKLYDPNGCLARRLMIGFNLSSSPFSSLHYENVTFLNCPRDYAMSNGLTSIDCLSNSTSKIIAISPKFSVGFENYCTPIVSLLVPFSFQKENKPILYNFKKDLRLTWNVPNCKDCEARGDSCGFQNISSDQISCSNNLDTGKPRGMKVFKIIALSIVLPAISGSICVWCFMCLVKMRQNSPVNEEATVRNLGSLSIDQQPSGLDESTIRTYKKVVIGESRRLPGPNGPMCPICLGDYNPNDTLRCIPECQHCFHSDCIDEWLRINGTCPVCRTNLSPA